MIHPTSTLIVFIPDAISMDIISDPFIDAIMDVICECVIFIVEASLDLVKVIRIIMIREPRRIISKGDIPVNIDAVPWTMNAFLPRPVVQQFKTSTLPEARNIFVPEFICQKLEAPVEGRVTKS